MQNPSCLLYGAGDVRFEDQPLPTIEDPHDVIVRIAYIGACSSDVRSMHNTAPKSNLKLKLNPRFTSGFMAASKIIMFRKMSL
jgi:threonine dehydrogenase-like Zn-dependent dehydrogenase